MRIIELEVHAVRGIRNLILKPEGENMVIVGPNGTGKSGIVDAIDFLLTGRIQRLGGTGTKSLTLRRHGVHVGARLADARVRAKVSLPGVAAPIEISRSLAKPSTVEVDSAYAVALAPALANAQCGQHSLSRREILRFIAAEPSDRAQQVQLLMRLNDVENCRKALMKVMNECKATSEEAERAFLTAEARVASAAQVAAYDPDELLAIVNKQRVDLGGTPLQALRPEGLQQELSPPATSAPTPVNADLARKDIAELKAALGMERTDNRVKVVQELNVLLNSLAQDPGAMRECRRLNLYQLGIELLDDTYACPLCDTDWPDGALASHLANKLEHSEALAAALKDVGKLTSGLADEYRKLRANASEVARVERVLAPNTASDSTLATWITELDGIERRLTVPVQEILLNPEAYSESGLLSQTPGLVSALEGLEGTLASAVPAVSVQQTAWDLLTRIEEHTKLLAAAQATNTRARHAATRAEFLYRAFSAAQNDVLQELYDQIRDRFVELYREVHLEDESGFGATMKPDGAGVSFMVDFYGEGEFPPNALHSEGHQDSMGLCLYLALAERLNRGILDVIVLDDVVMSVDAGHRRHICRLLLHHFPDSQFIITTHERAWADQLVVEGVAKASRRVRLYDWSLETGPLVDESPHDIWMEIDEKLRRNDISSAAHALRFYLEQFFRRTCGALGGQVRFNGAERWSLGDFLPASVMRLDRFVGTAINVAQSAGEAGVKDALVAYRERVKGARARYTTEQGFLNPAVHFNDWANYTRQDLVPMVNAMRELCDLFCCEVCGGVLEAVGKGEVVTEVRCSCGALMLRLSKHASAAADV